MAVSSNAPERKINMSLLNPRNFSRSQLIITALAFVLFGIFVILLTRAGAVVLTTVEAETMTVPAGAIIVNDSTASAAKALTLTANGSSNTQFSLSSAASALSVRAKGTQCNGAPEMVVKVDGIQVQSNTVSATGWTDYQSSSSLGAGTHSLTISFTNSYSATAGNSGKIKCSRSISVDKIELLGVTNDSIVSINDNTLGTGANQFEFVGSWNYLTSATTPSLANSFGGDEHYSANAGSYYQVRFNGTQAKIYLTTDVHHGIAGVSIDGGSESMVDTYAPTRANGVLVYTSPVLAEAAHTLKVRVTGTRNAASTGSVVVADKVEINSSSTPPPPLPTVRITSPTNGATITGMIPVEAIAAATNPSTVAKVEFSLDGVLKTTDTSAPYCLADANANPCTPWDSKSVVDGSHTITVYAYDSSGQKSLASTVSIMVKNSVAGCINPAPFPSRLKTSGRNLVDENGCPVKLKGFNMHIGPGFNWPQANFDEIKALAGGKVGNTINRAVLHWNQFEPTQGVVNATAIQNLDQHIRNAQAAGMYTMLELHLNVGTSPSWTTGRDETEKYQNNGATLTRYLANRYGSNNAVLGFGLNEPPLGDWIRNSTGTTAADSSTAWLEKVQSGMISWFRGSGAPGWIGFVAYGYASATPIYSNNFRSASPTAFEAVGGNVILDFHDYATNCTNSDPECTISWGPTKGGRQPNGTNYPTYQGGPLQGASGIGGYTNVAKTSQPRSLYRSQQLAHVKPYIDYGIKANMPIMVGEWGWALSPGAIGELEYIDDKMDAWSGLNAPIQIHWNYDVGIDKPGNYNEWSSKINSTTWRPSVVRWMQAP